MSSLFKSPLIGGFECSSHRRRDGRRLDLIGTTKHDQFAALDYRRLAQTGIKTARDGLRWHLIESTPARYDFASVERQMDGAQRAGVQVIWDLFHYGYPAFLDIFHVDFPARFADFAEAFAEYHARSNGGPLYVVPVNEISFFAYIAGDIGRFHPFATGRGDELKRQLVRAAISAIEAVRSVVPAARTLMSEPATFVTARREHPEFAEAAESYRTAQYEAFDMMSGRIEPELGGRPEYLDVIGLNYYPHNQWFYPDREMIWPGHELYRSFADILKEIYERYRRPMIVSETGTENHARAAWFRHVASQYVAAQGDGVDLNGLCLYPILNHPGWEDERHCHNGLWDYCDENGARPIYEPLAREIRAFADQAAASASRPAGVGPFSAREVAAATSA